MKMETAKKTEALDRLQRRQVGRNVQLENSRCEKQGVVNLREAIGHFWSEFSELKDGIEQRLALEESLQKDPLTVSAHFDEISQSLKSLKKSLSDTSHVLPAYDIRTAQETINRLQELFLEKQEACLPRKKFTFKNRSKKEDKPLKTCKDIVDAPQKLPQNTANNPLLNNTSFCGFSDVAGETLVLHRDRVSGEDVVLQQLNKCTVTIYGTPNTVHMSGLDNCRILLGPTFTSVFVENCRSCTFAVACQQLRIHSTTSCDVYVHVESRIIVEDCTQMRFAPFHFQYDGVVDDLLNVGLNCDVIRWNVVDDFNWLALDVKSPNWTEIPINERIAEWR